jgi:hypothetical protein
MIFGSFLSYFSTNLVVFWDIVSSKILLAKIKKVRPKQGVPNKFKLVGAIWWH